MQYPAATPGMSMQKTRARDFAVSAYEETSTAKGDSGKVEKMSQFEIASIGEFLLLPLLRVLSN